MKRNSSKIGQRLKTIAGFTLVELVVVIAIIAILAGIGAVAYNGYITQANKALDKQTVGQVMEALELADYNDPSLFPDGSSATVFITTEKGIIAYASGGTGKISKINSALSDTFGDISKVNLSYKEWEGGTNAESLKALSSKLKAWLDDTSDRSNVDYIDKYFENLNSNKMASFAGDIDSFWGDVEIFAEAMNKEDSNYLSRIVEYCNKNKNKISDVLTVKPGADGKLPPEDDSDDKKIKGAQLGAYLAANYAFAAWVQNEHPEALADPEINALVYGLRMHDENLERFIQGGFSSYYVQIDEKINDSKIDLATQTTLKNLRTEYLENQADTDINAVLALMQAANTLQNADGTLPNDDEFIPEARKTINASSSILNGSMSVDDLLTLATTMTEASGDSNAISVMAEKKNGVLVLTPVPDEANPRPKNTITPSKGEEEEKPTTCEATNHTGSITIRKDSSSGKPMFSLTNTLTGQFSYEDLTGKNTIYLCSIIDKKTCNVLVQNFGIKDTDYKITLSCEDGSVEYSGTKLTAVKTGNATLTFELLTGNNSGTTYAFNIVVH